MTDKHARDMTAAEFRAAKDAMWREAAERKYALDQQATAASFVRRTMPDHDAWLEKHGLKPITTTEKPAEPEETEDGTN